MLYCGLRPSETIPLIWKDVDFEKKQLTVNKSNDTRSNQTKEPKTKAGKRTIPIPDILISELQAAAGTPFDYLFTQPTTGKRHTNSSMRQMWESFLKELDIAMGAQCEVREVPSGLGVRKISYIASHAIAPDLVPYCLRHTYCTDLQAAGVPINVAKELMGHSDISMTSKVYTHKSQEAFDNAADAINRHIQAVAGDTIGDTIEPAKTRKKRA